MLDKGAAIFSVNFYSRASLDRFCALPWNRRPFSLAAIYPAARVKLKLRVEAGNRRPSMKSTRPRPRIK